MNREVYLIVVTGQGDTEVKVVDEETFEWLDSPYPSETGEASVRDIIPPRIEEIMRAFWRNDIGEEMDDTDLSVSSGSWDNDRALMVVSTVEGYEAQYSSLKDALDDIKTQGDTVVDTWEGLIY